jgi:hypothetical protein
MELYKIWVQLDENLTILDPGTEVFFVRMTHEQRVGTMKLYHVFERNSEKQKKRLKVKLIPSSTKELRKPTSLKTDYFKGIFFAKNFLDKLFTHIPAKFSEPPYDIAALIKIPYKDKYYIISLRSSEELLGFVYVLKWFHIPEDEVIIRVEDIFDNQIKIPSTDYFRESVEA